MSKLTKNIELRIYEKLKVIYSSLLIISVCWLITTKTTALRYNILILSNTHLWGNDSNSFWSCCRCPRAMRAKRTGSTRCRRSRRHRVSQARSSPLPTTSCCRPTWRACSRRRTCCAPTSASTRTPRCRGPSTPRPPQWSKRWSTRTTKRWWSPRSKRPLRPLTTGNRSTRTFSSRTCPRSPRTWEPGQLKSEKNLRKISNFKQKNCLFPSNFNKPL